MKLSCNGLRIVQTAVMSLIVTGAIAAPPPVLKEQGSFFVNGEVVQIDNPGGDNPGGRIVVSQMYVAPTAGKCHGADVDLPTTSRRVRMIMLATFFLSLR